MIISAKRENKLIIFARNFFFDKLCSFRIHEDIHHFFSFCIQERIVEMRGVKHMICFSSYLPKLIFVAFVNHQNPPLLSPMVLETNLEEMGSIWDQIFYTMLRKLHVSFLETDQKCGREGVNLGPNLVNFPNFEKISYFMFWRRIRSVCGLQFVGAAP